MDNAQVEEIKRHFGVVAEGLERKIQLVAEGITNVDEKLERFRQEVKEEFKKVKSMIKFSYAELDRRVRTNFLLNAKNTHIIALSGIFNIELVKSRRFQD
jgi:hypothetical protein